MKIIIVGGGTGGATLAFQIRKIDKECEIEIIERSNNLQYSPCALPYAISGEISTFEDIFIFDEEQYSQNKITFRKNTKAIKIFPKKKQLLIESNDEKQLLSFDILVIATGASPVIPPIDGISKENCLLLKTIDDAKNIKNTTLKENQHSSLLKSTIIIGAGLIGVELSTALKGLGQNVTLIDSKNILSSNFDTDMSLIVKDYLIKNEITIFENSKIQKVEDSKIFLDGKIITFDNIIICAGVRPNLDLAIASNIKTNKGIIVNPYMQTSKSFIYAIGDCVESKEFYSNETVLSLIATSAVRQSKIVAGNIFGAKEKFPTVLNTTISRAKEIIFGAVGISSQRAISLGIKTVSAKYVGETKSEYIPTRKPITIKIIADMNSTIIGAQIIGFEEIAGRLDLLALAITKKMKLSDLENVEFCYNPMSAPIFEPISIVAHLCQKKLNSL